MQNRVPVPREARVPLPDFTPVPRKYRHDGWTPERQKAFIEALADTGSVTRAAGLVNIAQRNAYALRRAPGAEEFRRAWDAALDFGVQRLKDVAFERAMNGELIPVFIGGRLRGFRRKYNDTLLMFCLRHYGQDTGGKRTTINYFSTRAQAGAVAGGAGTSAGEAGAAAGAGAAAEISTTTVRTVITGDGGDSGVSGSEGKASKDDELAGQLLDFDGVELDAEARAAIDAALLACAERRRAVNANIALEGDIAVEQQLLDPETDYVRVADDEGALPARVFEQYPDESAPDTFIEGEAHWVEAGKELGEQEMAMLHYIESAGKGCGVMLEPAERDGAAIANSVAEVKRPKPRNNWDKRPRREGG